MKRKIERDEQQYIDIENFLDFELTNCIAFEMAIRNDTILDLFTRFNYVWYRNIDSINLSEDMIEDSQTNQLYLENELTTKYFLVPYDTNTLLLLYNFSKLHNITIYQKLLKQNTESLKNLTDENTQCNYRNRIIFYNTTIYNNHTILSTTSQINKKVFNNEYEPNDFFYEKFNAKDENVLLEDINHSIIVNYSRPKFIIPNSISKNLNILGGINFNLPLKEIQSLIEEIYYSFVSTKKAMTPIELLTEYMNKAEREIVYKKPRGKEKLQNLDNYLNNKKKMADLFYIYDAYKIGMSQESIQREISFYHGTHTVNADTINLYYSIAKDYIDNLRYKELITGTNIL